MAIPRDRGLDSTLALLKEGYAFIPERCRVYGSDLFATRLMGTRVVCVTGAEAAGHFYAPDRFTRRGAGTEEIKLFHEAHVPLTEAVCEWVGLPLDEAEAEERAREFEAMVEGTGSVGPRNWRGHLLRARTERWMRDVVRQIRAGERDAPEGGAARTVAEHRDGDGELLDLRTAAVELINVLRPTVANARLVVFAAHALHEHPECREALRSADEAETERFVHEVRRFYPFIPLIGGKVLASFEWRGHRFAPGDWALMDIYG